MSSDGLFLKDFLRAGRTLACAPDLEIRARNLILSGGEDGPSRARFWILALSGGLDSITLLHILHGLAPEFGAELHVLHCCHGLRGEESLRDALYCRRLCEELNVPCHLSDCQLAKGPGLQERARELRVRAIIELAGFLSENDCAMNESLAKPDQIRTLHSNFPGVWIATAHHLSDQAETVLFRLLRGTGPAGLVGTAPLEAPFFRPLSSSTRPEILAWARKRGIQWVEDSSNLTLDYTRNRLRKQVLPGCAEIMGHDPASAIGFLALEMAGWKSIVQEWAFDFLVNQAEAVFSGDGPSSLMVSRRALASLPSDRLMVLLSIVFAHLGMNPSRSVLSGLIDLFRGKAWKTMNLQGGVAEFFPQRVYLGPETDSPLFRLMMRAGDNKWRISTPGRNGDRLSAQSVKLELGMVVTTPALRISVLGSDPEEDSNSPHSLLDMRTMDGASDLYFGPRRGGENFRNLGRGPVRPLKKVLMESSLPQPLREHIPLLWSDSLVVWVPGAQQWTLRAVLSSGERVLIQAVPLGGWDEF